MDADSVRQLREEFITNEHGIIQDPGKFEGEMIYVPAYWDMGLEGMADEDDGEHFVFNIGQDGFDDRAFWPEIPADQKRIILYENSDGFVNEIDEATYQASIAGDEARDYED